MMKFMVLREVSISHLPYLNHKQQIKFINKILDLIKTVLYNFFLMFTCLSSIGQINLVPNGSFEEFNNCPDYASGFYIDA